MHRYRDTDEDLLKEHHPSRMPTYIVAGLSAVMAGFAVYEFTKSTQAPCNTASVPTSEIMENACNHPVPKP